MSVCHSRETAQARSAEGPSSRGTMCARHKGDARRGKAARAALSASTITLTPVVRAVEASSRLIRQTRGQLSSMAIVAARLAHAATSWAPCDVERSISMNPIPIRIQSRHRLPWRRICVQRQAITRDKRYMVQRRVRARFLRDACDAEEADAEADEAEEVEATESTEQESSCASSSQAARQVASLPALRA